MQHGDNNNAEQQDEERSALFTVKDIEAALIYFACMTGLYPFIVIAHEIYHGWKGGYPHLCWRGLKPRQRWGG